MSFFFLKTAWYKNLHMNFIFHHSYMVQCISEYLDIIIAVLSQCKHLKKLLSTFQTSDMIRNYLLLALTSFTYKCNYSPQQNCLTILQCLSTRSSLLDRGSYSVFWSYFPRASLVDRKNFGLIFFFFLVR